MPLLRSTLTSPQKPPLLSHRSVARCTELRRRRSYVDGCIFLLASCNHHYDHIMLDPTYELLLNSKTETEPINSKLLVQHACHVRKFKTRNWNTYMKHVPSPSHITQSTCIG